MITVLYLIPAAVFAAALGAACWWCWALRRVLSRERVAARLTQSAAARAIASLEGDLQRLEAERAVLAATETVIDTVAEFYLTTNDQQQHRKGGGGDV